MCRYGATAQETRAWIKTIVDELHADVNDVCSHAEWRYQSKSRFAGMRKVEVVVGGENAPEGNLENLERPA